MINQLDWAFHDAAGLGGAEAPTLLHALDDVAAALQPMDVGHVALHDSLGDSGTLHAPDAVKQTAFDPSKFVINPKNLPAGAAQIANAIMHGYAAASAIKLLETDANKVHVSGDDMLLLTEQKLEATAGTVAQKAVVAFDAEMKARLTTGAAELQIATLVHGGHLTAAAGGAIVVAEAKEATPTAPQEAHALAQYLADLTADHVAARQIDAVAKANAALIIGGLDRENALGGVHAPKAVDIQAGARVFEAGLGAFTAAAFNAVMKEFKALEGTAGEWTLLDKIETAGLQHGVADKLITAAQKTTWDTSFDTAHNKFLWSQVDALAQKYVAGQLSDSDAAADLKAMAATQAAADALLLGAARNNPSDAIATALARLAADASAFGAVVDTNGVHKILSQLLADIVATPAGHAVDAKYLLPALALAINFGAKTDAQGVTLVTQAANTDKADGPDAWLLAAANGMGGAATAYNAGYGHAFLALANVMAARVKSGAFLAHVVAEYKAGTLTLASANSLVEAYAKLAMASDRTQASTALNRLADPELTQVDGVTADDRIGYELIQFLKEVKAKAPGMSAAATKYIYDTDTAYYLTGLGFTAGMGSDKTIATNLITANNVIKVADMADVTAAGKNAGSGNIAGTQTVSAANAAIYAKASADALAAAQAFFGGLNSYSGDIAPNAVQPTASPAGSILDGVENIISDPGNYSNFVTLAEAGLNYVVDGANPVTKLLGKIGGGANGAAFILEQTGLGSLLSPLTGTLRGVGTFANEGVDILNTALDGFLVAPAGDILFGAATTIFDEVKNLGEFTKDIFTGDFSGAKIVAGNFAMQLQDDVGAIATAVTNDMLKTAYALANEIETIANTIADSLESIESLFTSAANAVENAFSDAWSDVESIY